MILPSQAASAPVIQPPGAATPSESTPEALQWSAGSVETCPLLPILFPLTSSHPPLTLSQAPDFMDTATHQAYSCHRPLALAVPPVRYSPKYPEGSLPHPLAYSFIFAQNKWDSHLRLFFLYSQACFPSKFILQNTRFWLNYITYYRLLSLSSLYSSPRRAGILVSGYLQQHRHSVHACWMNTGYL